MSTVRKAAGAVLMLLGLSAPALGADNLLTLLIGGEAYDGPPRFEVMFNGTVIGEGAVESAIDTATVGRFADAADKSPYVQSFYFEIPDAVFSPEGEVRVRLVNEAYGGDGSNRDRNLYLAAVTVNGQAVTLSGLATLTQEGGVPNETLGEFLVLPDNNQQGVSKAPEGGWPGAETLKAPVTAEAGTAPAERPPAAVRQLEVASAAPADAAAPVAAAAPEQPAGAELACQTDEIFNVLGFNENSNDLTPRLMQRLDQIVAALGTQSCKATITGYSSTQGDYATNALFSVERAQNVLTYLRQQGVRFAEVTATGAGETTQFGDGLNANRRVVINVRP